jgi:hypothetical protein
MHTICEYINARYAINTPVTASMKVIDNLELNISTLPLKLRISIKPMRKF